MCCVITLPQMLPTEVNTMSNDPLSLDKWYKAPFAQVHARRHYNFAGHVYQIEAPLDALLDDLRQYVDTRCSPQALFETDQYQFVSYFVADPEGICHITHRLGMVGYSPLILEPKFPSRKRLNRRPYVRFTLSLTYSVAPAATSCH